MSPRLIDTHCHVHFSAYKNDADEVTRRALQQNIGLITVGTQSTTSKNAVAHARKFANVWAAVGLHPSHLFKMRIDEDELPAFMSRAEEFDADYYRELAADEKVVAIGETGIDTFRLPENINVAAVFAKQEKNFRRHLDLADELNKPIIIHCRDAHEQTSKILEEYLAVGKLERRGVLHCFTGSATEAAHYAALGFYIGISGIICFPPRARQSENALNAVVRATPLDKLLIETDAPYLAPPPYRGQRNEPSYVTLVAEHLARILERPCVELTVAFTANAKKLFSLDVCEKNR